MLRITHRSFTQLLTWKISSTLKIVIFITEKLQFKQFGDYATPGRFLSRRFRQERPFSIDHECRSRMPRPVARDVQSETDHPGATTCPPPSSAAEARVPACAVNLICVIFFVWSWKWRGTTTNTFVADYFRVSLLFVVLNVVRINNVGVVI